LKMDIKNFFISINKNILWNLIKDNKTIWDIRELVKLTVYHDPTTNYSFKGDSRLKSKVPKHKSLFNAKPNCGLPIGNLTSQFFANIYLNQLDQYCKRQLKIKKYIRYVDDIVVVSRNINLLNNIYDEINTFLFLNLNLQLHPNKKTIINVQNGVDFVGKVIYPYHIKLRKRTINNLIYCIENKYSFIDLRDSLNSYFGMLRLTDSFNFRQFISLKYDYLKFDEDYTKLIAYL
jgi:hypothetical protein